MFSPLETASFKDAPDPHKLHGNTIENSPSTGRFPTLDGTSLGRSPANHHASFMAAQRSHSCEHKSMTLKRSVPQELVSTTMSALSLAGQPNNPDEASTPVAASSASVSCRQCERAGALNSVFTPLHLPSRTVQLKTHGGLTRLFGQPAAPVLAHTQSPVMAQAHWDFVDALLAECKHRTKRMVIQKMGHEAMNLGHNYQSVSEVEENTLVSGLCELLERIWSHGLKTKRSSSALWSHLLFHMSRNSMLPYSTPQVGRRSVTESRNQPIVSVPDRKMSDSLYSTLPTQSPSFSMLRRKPPIPKGPENGTSQKEEKTNSNRGRSRDTLAQKPNSISRSSSLAPTLDMLRSPGVNRKRNILSDWVSRSFTPTESDGSTLFDASSLLEQAGNDETNFRRDLAAVLAVPDVKTHVGCARAFVRLALEKKRLSTHFKVLLSDTALLRELYLRHAFLRCEEEREQCLVHLLALTAVDYFSFTRMLHNADLVYRLALVSGRRHIVQCTANLWIRLQGHLGISRQITFSRSHTYHQFKCQNLGILNTLRIGHDNAGISPKLFVEAVIVCTPLVGHVYVFPCNHWIGRSMEDGSCERLLIGKIVQVSSKGTFISRSGVDITETISPSTLSLFDSSSHSSGSLGQSMPNMECVVDSLANAVNRLAKHFANSGTEGELNLSALLCGEGGLVSALDGVFSFGLKTGGLFQKKLYAWDFFEHFVENRLSQHADRAGGIEKSIGGFNVSFLSPSPAAERTEADSRCQRVVPPRSLNSGAAASFVASGCHWSPALSRLKSHRRVYVSGSLSISQPCSPATPRVRNTNSSTQNTSRPIHLVVEHFVAIFNLVNRTSHNVGKLGKFQRLVCIGCRDHALSCWFPVLASSSAALHLYNERSLIRSRELRSSVQALLTSLNDFPFRLDPVILGE